YALAFHVYTSSVSVHARPVRTTAFPYTTLFRSIPTWQSVLTGRKHENSSGRTLLRSGAAGRGRLLPGAGRRQCRGRRRQGRGLRARKSTRLNSSHVKISYAVFCLKKRKGGISMI